MKRVDRFGVNSDTALGWCFVPENKMYRIIFRDGMRYDFGFEFEYADNIKLDLGEQPDAGEQNDNWPAENINRFWFVQIQALGKLYRKDWESKVTARLMIFGQHLPHKPKNKGRLLPKLLTFSGTKIPEWLKRFTPEQGIKAS